MGAAVVSYEAPRHIAVVNLSTLATDAEVARWVEAGRLQLARDVAPVWGYPPPGVFMYPPDARFSAETAMIAAIVDDDGNDDAAGLHGSIGRIPYILVDARQSTHPSRTLSHELIEAYANQHLDRWLEGPDRMRFAVELCDPVQADGYDVEVELLGAKARVEVSDFIYPAWFDVDAVDGARTHHLAGSFQPLEPFELARGGYAIAEVDGRIVFLAPYEGAEMPARKFAPWGRTSRIVRGGRKGSDGPDGDDPKAA